MGSAQGSASVCPYPEERHSRERVFERTEVHALNGAGTLGAGKANSLEASNEGVRGDKEKGVKGLVGWQTFPSLHFSPTTNTPKMNCGE